MEEQIMTCGPECNLYFQDIGDLHYCGRASRNDQYHVKEGSKCQFNLRRKDMQPLNGILDVNTVDDRVEFPFGMGGSL